LATLLNSDVYRISNENNKNENFGKKRLTQALTLHHIKGDLNVFLIHYGAFLGKNELEFLLDLGGIIPLLHVPATTTTTTATTKRDCPPKKSCD